MANYKHTPANVALASIQEGAENVQAHVLDAHDALGVYPVLDDTMDGHQDAAYGLLKAIALKSTDKGAQARAKAALMHFARAEEIERLMEQKVQEGNGSVILARDENERVIETANGARRQTREAVGV